ncbi:unnamed protein product [Clonostachys rhizophaga]|uniref:F-box domain-containing protein n=1 Tax=Clonostachys rhizophaga TaxID=160324 RepID=A0A9N9YK91_9HYPO|nr:unnamed protein product [Clonostachys rhizophaga]
MSATEQALRLPELLLAVFELIMASDRSLVPTTQVNRAWFDCATSFLWRKVYSRVLYRVPEHRRQIYASKIEKIEFDGEEGDIHEAFKGLQFDHLKSVSLDLFNPPKGGSTCLRQYIQPTLQSFNFCGGDLDDEFLLQMKASCTRLRAVTINLPGPRVTPSAFLNFISGSECLEEVNLNDMEGLLSDAMFLNLAGRSNLFHLSWGTSIPPRLISRTSNEIPAPFKNVRKITTSVSTSSVAWISQNMVHLTHLILKLEDCKQDVLQPLPKLPNLKRVRLSFEPRTVLSTESLVALRSLNKLETLDLASKTRGMKVFNARGGTFQNPDFENLISGLPLLRQLSLVIEAQLSVRAGAILAKHCPLIQECNILKNFDTRLLMALAPEDKPMFPFLQRLNVRRATFDRHEEPQTLEQSADKLIALIRKNCPDLKMVVPSLHNPYSNLVARRFDSLNQPADPLPTLLTQ